MEQKTSVVAWLALIISILALILAWNAFNRAGQDLEQMVAEQVDEAVQELRVEYRQTEDAVLEGTAETLETGAAGLDAGAEALNAGADASVDAASETRSAQ